jgi:hypothetical protein
MEPGSASDSGADITIDNALLQLEEHVETESTPGDDAANEDGHSRPSDTTEDQRQGIASPETSARTGDAAGRGSDVDESEDDDMQASEQRSSPEIIHHRAATRMPLSSSSGNS